MFEFDQQIEEINDDEDAGRDVNVGDGDGGGGRNHLFTLHWSLTTAYVIWLKKSVLFESKNCIYLCYFQFNVFNLILCSMTLKTLRDITL